MAVWLMCWLHCLLCEESTLFHVEIATDAEQWEHQQMIVETTCCARENAHALNHGGAKV